MSEEMIEIEPLTDAEVETTFIALIGILDGLGCAPAATITAIEPEGASFSLHFDAKRARKLVSAYNSRRETEGGVGRGRSPQI